MAEALEGGTSRLPLELRNISTVTTAIFSPLQHFCCCISLINGVRIITVVSLLFGVGFIQLGSMHNDMEFTGIIAVFCQFTGFLFFFWFLTLLLLQSLQLHRLRRLSAWTALGLIGWICLMTVIYITFSCISFTFQLETGEKILLSGTVFSYILAFIVVFYSYCVLSSYLSVLKDIQRSLTAASESNFALSISPKPVPSSLRNVDRSRSKAPARGNPEATLTLRETMQRKNADRLV